MLEKDNSEEIVSKLTQPVVHPKVWNNIPNKYTGETIRLTDQGENTQGDEQTEIAEQNQVRILGFIQRAPGIEMVDTTSNSITFAFATAFTLRLMVVVTCDVEEQICRPPTKLLGNQIIRCGKRGFLGKFLELMKKVTVLVGIRLLGVWHENHVSLHVTSCLVMLSVGDLPREIWN